MPVAAPSPTSRVSAECLPAVPGFSDAKRRVLEAAIVLFGARGYHAVSVRDIAGSVGLTPMALYTHAPSKQDLLFEIVRIGFETHRAAIDEALLDSGAAPVDQMRSLCSAHVRVHLRHAALARVTNRETGQLDARFLPLLDQLRANSVQPFRDVLTRGQRLGVFIDANAVLLLHAVSSMGLRAPSGGPPTATCPWTRWSRGSRRSR